MSDQRKLLEMALSALRAAVSDDQPYISECRDVIEQLEAELAKPVSRAAHFTRRPSLWAMEARQALELIAAPVRPDGTWNRDREACRQLAAEALGRYDD
jgi:hypothetical protein